MALRAITIGGRIAAGLLLIALAIQPCSVSYPRKLRSKLAHSTSKLFAFERNGRVGFIDPTGRVVIPPEIQAPIEDVGDFSNGFARVGTQGFIDETGKWAFKGNYRWLEDFSGGFARASIDDPDREYWQLDLILDRNGSIVARVPRLRLRSFSEGLVAFESEGKPAIRNWQPGHFDYRDFPGLQGFLDSTGNVAIPATFADVGPFVDGLARAALDGYCHLVTWDNGKEGSPTSGYPTSCGGAPDDAVTICKVGFIYRNGAFAIPPEFESGQDFQEGLAAVRIGGRWGFIDRDGKFAVAPRFQQTQSFSEGLAAVKIGRKWGFIDRSGALEIEAQFDSVEPFSDSLALVSSDKRQFFIDRSGRVAIQGPFREATPFVQGLASILLDEKHVAYINKSGKTVFEYSRH